MPRYNKNDEPKEFYAIVSSGKSVLTLIDESVYGKNAGYTNEKRAIMAVKDYLNKNPGEWGVVTTVTNSFTSKVVIDDVTDTKDQGDSCG